MIDEAFQAFDKMDSHVEGEIAEISVKQSQFVISFVDQQYIKADDIEALSNLQNVSDITCYNNELFVAMRDVEEQWAMKSEHVQAFYRIILTLRDHVCQCPNLEYVISHDYLKVYLDVPNIQLSALAALIQLFKQDPFVEFGADRPFLLFINESSYAEEIE